VVLTINGGDIYDAQGLRIVKWDIELLRKKSVPLTGPLPEWYIETLRSLCEKSNGVFISGIQVGDARRFCVPCKINNESQHYDHKGNLLGFPVIYNPKILDLSDKAEVIEGCLSFPFGGTKVYRYKVVEFEYRDQDWNPVRVVAGSCEHYLNSWALAHALQHEVNHMDGVLFFDHADKKIKKSMILRASAELRKVRLENRPGLIVGPQEIIIDEKP
jgi:peptide deformylase